MKHEDCEMKDDLTKAIEGIKNQNRWFMSIFGGAIILLLVGYGNIGTTVSNNTGRITKINNDYAPLIVIQDIMENNDRFIKIIQLIPQTDKDDPRYLDAIREREIFQREALQRASGTKRSGSSYGGGGSE